MSQRYAAAILAGVLALPGGGCFFASPIDVAPGVDLDPSILGTWRCLPMPNPREATAVFVVSSSGERRYQISVRERGVGPLEFEAHASLVNGRRVLNLRGPTPKPWTFARYSFLQPDLVRVELVDPDMLKGVEDSPASLRGALERQGGSPDLFKDGWVCTPVSGGEPPLPTEGPTPEKPTAVGRKGFLVGFSFGGGQIDCEDCDSRGAGAFDFRLGWTVTERFSLQATIGAVAREEGPASLSTVSLTGGGQYWLGRRFWLGAGVGVGEDQVEVEGRVFGSGTSLALTASGGVDLLRRGRFVLDLRARYDRLTEFGTDNWAVAAGFTWY